MFVRTRRMDLAERRLPAHVLERATLRGNEFAWPVSYIPKVIEAARLGGLVNIGGQLQFRFPSGGTAECYWVEVSTSEASDPELPWTEQVERSAREALSQFKALQSRYNFLAEGRNSFGQYIREFEASGGNASDAMCFVWYVEASPYADRKILSAEERQATGSLFETEAKLISKYGDGAQSE